MSKLLKGSRVRNGYDPRQIGTVIGFRLVPIVKYDDGSTVVEALVKPDLASKKKGFSLSKRIRNSK